MNTYQHVLPGMQAEAAALFSEVLAESARKAAPRPRPGEADERGVGATMTVAGVLPLSSGGG